jgi:hypothetical protein
MTALGQSGLHRWISPEFRFDSENRHPQHHWSCPKGADFVAEVGCSEFGRLGLSLKAADFDRPAPDALSTTATLRNAQGQGGWWPSNQRCEPPQVLSDRGQNKLILGASRAT